MTAVQRCGKNTTILSTPIFIYLFSTMNADALFLEFHYKLIEDGYGKGKREPMNQSKREILIQESLNQPFDCQ